MINRLVEPTSGNIQVDGYSICDVDVIELRRSIGYVIQSGGLLPHMTVARNIWLPQEAIGTSHDSQSDRVAELLELVGLDPSRFSNRYPSELSGGQQQRVGIARALVSDPPVLLMDEPFGALDPITRRRLQDELLSINKRLNKTIVLVTHDIHEAFRLGSDIILLSDGAIVQRGGAVSFVDAPSTDFVREFVSSQLYTLSGER